MYKARIAKSFHEVMKFNPFHDELGRFANKHGFKTYSANPKMKVAQPSINRSATAGHGRTLNVHRESKGENIGQNYLWLHGHNSPTYVSPPQQTTRTKPQKPQGNTSASSKQNKPTQQTTSNQTAINSNVAKGKAENAVDGKDLSGKFKFDNNSTDYSIEQVIKAQGFDGKPTITNDPQAFASACKASNFAASRGVGASDTATLKKYDDDLKYGDFYVKCSGGSVHGYGMYAASFEVNNSYAQRASKDAQSTANSYAAGGNVKKIYSMTLDKSAKIGTENALQRQMRNDKEYKKVCDNSSLNKSYTMDVGVYAAYKGYDAYVANSGRSGYGHSDYTVILNRSKVILFESQP